MSTGRINYYDQILFLLVVSSVFGYIGPFFFQPIIFLTLAFSLKLIQSASMFRFRRNKKALLIFTLLFIYAAVSIFWSPNFKKSLILLIRAAVHIILCLEIIVFSQRAKRPLESIAKGWVAAFLLTSVIAVWEMVTDHHIMVIAQQDMVWEIERHRAAVTFYNINTYSLFVIFSLPFLLYRMMWARGHHRTPMLFCLLLLMSIVFLNASRAAILSMVIMMGVYMFSILGKGDKRSKRSVFLIIGLIGCFLLIAGSFLLEAILFRTENRDMFQDNARLTLWASSLELFVLSHGFGQGFGSMVPAMEAYSGNMTTVNYTHNLIFQLLLEGGVVFCIPFLFFLLKIFRSARKQKDLSRRMFLFAVLLSFPLFSILNSENISPSFIWLFFVSVYVFSAYSGPVAVRAYRPVSPDIRVKAVVS